MKKFDSLYIRYMINGSIIGAGVGVVITLFRIFVELIQEKMIEFFELARTSTQYTIGIFAVIILAGLITGFLTYKEPYIGGSGIPQVLGKLKDKMMTNWKTVLPLKFIGGLFVLGTGLTVGREGPSVQMGASVGQAFSDIRNFSKEDKNNYMTAGAAAGLSSAFSAPLAGLVFVLEELYHKFDRVIFITTLAAAAVANYVSDLIMGNDRVLYLGAINPMELTQFHWLILFGIIMGLMAPIFTKGVEFTKNIYNWMPIPVYLKIVIPFLVTGLVIYFIPQAFGSGEHYIFLPLRENMALQRIVILMVAKFILLILAFSSGMPGGIFLPMLVLGSLIGNFYGQVLFSLGFIPAEYVLLFSALGMGANFSSIVRSPLTGMVLLLELTGSFTYFLPIGVVILVSYVVVESIKLDPVYDMLLDKMLKAKKED